MAPLHKAPFSGAKTLQHPTHPKHPLEEVQAATEYMCDGCYALGSGTRYHCSACDFDLHEHCARCPTMLSSYLHPQHALILKNKIVNDRFCDVCGDLVNGLFYACEACDLDVHPLCTLLPLNAQHALHPQHLLTLQPAKPSWCAVCRQVCNYWRYRCNTCCLDVHPECVLGPSDVPSGSLGQSPARQVPPPSPYGDYAFGIPCTGGYPIPMNQGFHMGMSHPMHQRQSCSVTGMNQPFYQGQAGFGMATSQPSPQGQAGSGMATSQLSNQGQARKGKSIKRKIYSVVGRLAVSAAITSLIGVPIGFGS